MINKDTPHLKSPKNQNRRAALGQPPFLNSPKDLDPSYKMDLDFWDCFGRKQTLSYNQRNMVLFILEHIFNLILYYQCIYMFTRIFLAVLTHISLPFVFF